MAFHAFDPDDRMFNHNIFLGKGRIVAASAILQAHPGMSGVMSPYQAFTRERAKEEAFEQIRAREYPARPTRLGSIFLFPTRESADKANVEWWGNRRIILAAVVVQAASVGVFDSRQLNATVDQWEAAARLYWGGAFTADPTPEMVVCGTIQLIGWEPYGKLMAP